MDDELNNDDKPYQPKDFNNDTQDEMEKCLITKGIDLNKIRNKTSSEISYIKVLKIIYQEYKMFGLLHSEYKIDQ